MLNLKKTFQSNIDSFYITIYFFLGVIPANIDDFLSFLAGTTQFGVGFILTSGLISDTISMIMFGYFSEVLSSKGSLDSDFWRDEELKIMRCLIT